MRSLTSEKDIQQLSGLQRQIQINKNSLIFLLEQSVKKAIKNQSSIEIQQRVNECLIACFETIQKNFPVKKSQIGKIQKNRPPHKPQSQPIKSEDSQSTPPDESLAISISSNIDNFENKSLSSESEVSLRKKIRKNSNSKESKIQDKQIVEKNVQQSHTKNQLIQKEKNQKKLIGKSDQRGRKRTQTTGNIINQFLKEQRQGYKEFFTVIYRDGKQNNPIYKCKYCPNTLYYHRQHCSVHWKTKHCLSRYQCSICAAQYFSTVVDYFIHFYVYHNQQYDIREEDIQCNFCERICNKKSLYGKHIISQHFDNIKSKLIKFKEEYEERQKFQK